MFTNPLHLSLFPFPSLTTFSFQIQDRLFEDSHKFLKGLRCNIGKATEDGRRFFGFLQVKHGHFHSLTWSYVGYDYSSVKAKALNQEVVKGDC